MSTAKELQKSVGLFGAVALALGIVVGAGMLTLPGLVYQETGGWATFAWLIDAVIVLPLLFVFVSLGRRFPTAGGVAGFVGQAFPRLHAGCAYLLIGTFGLGIPAIALTGAGYAAAALGVGTGRWEVAGLAAVFLGLALVAALSGARLAGFVQNALVVLLIGGLAAMTLSTAPHWETIDMQVGDPSLLGVWQGAALAFFAYTGWEMLSFIAEEMKNPRRDFALACGISLVLVTALYVGASLAVQAIVPLDHPLLGTAPFLAVVQGVFPGEAGLGIVAAIAGLIILANLNGAVWAASRLVYDVGRHRQAPACLGLGRVNGDGTPTAAVLAIGVVLAAVLAGFGLGLWDLGPMLRLAGQNFFLLYALSIVVFLKLSASAAGRGFAVATLALCLAFTPAFGWGLLYAAALFSVPYAARRLHAVIKIAPSVTAK